MSPDDVKSHRRFREKHSLPFTLIADTDHAIAESYGVWREKSMYGKKYWGNIRTTFLIDSTGRITHLFEKVKPEGHATQVLQALEEQLQAGREG